MSKAGISIITVEADESYFDMEDIWTDMRNKVNDTQLPIGAGQPMVDDDVGDEFPYLFALRGDGFTPAELEDHAEDIRDQILAVPGVGKVTLHGNQSERIYLEFSSAELAARGASPSQVQSLLSLQNAVVTRGETDHGPERMQIVTLGEFESLQQPAKRDPYC